MIWWFIDCLENWHTATEIYLHSSTVRVLLSWSGCGNGSLWKISVVLLLQDGERRRIYPFQKCGKVPCFWAHFLSWTMDIKPNMSTLCKISLKTSHSSGISLSVEKYQHNASLYSSMHRSDLSWDEIMNVLLCQAFNDNWTMSSECLIESVHSHTTLLIQYPNPVAPSPSAWRASSSPSHAHLTSWCQTSQTCTSRVNMWNRILIWELFYPGVLLTGVPLTPWWMALCLLDVLVYVCV